mgnify:CR=1 FL=1
MRYTGVPLLKAGHFKRCRAFAIIYPLRDTEQNEPIGFEICKQNTHAMGEADLALIYWDPESQGSLSILVLYLDSGILPASRRHACLIGRKWKKAAEIGKKLFERMLLSIAEPSDYLNIYKISAKLCCLWLTDPQLAGSVIQNLQRRGWNGTTSIFRGSVRKTIIYTGESTPDSFDGM